MTDQEIFEWGDKAEALINNPDYIKLYEKITMDLAKGILATTIDDVASRKDLYNTYAGMRAFGNTLAGMVLHKEALIKAQEEEAEANMESN